MKEPRSENLGSFYIYCRIGIPLPGLWFRTGRSSVSEKSLVEIHEVDLLARTGNYDE